MIQSQQNISYIYDANVKNSVLYRKVHGKNMDIWTKW